MLRFNTSDDNVASPYMTTSLSACKSSTRRLRADGGAAGEEATDMVVDDAAPPRKKKPGHAGRADLNREGTISALNAWLRKLNAEHAPKHGVRLVWCKENTRAGGSMQRTFMYTDLKTRRAKPCANGSAAIQLMQELTGCDFYADMRQRSHEILTDDPTE